MKKHNFAVLGLMRCPCSAAITAEKKIKPSGKEYIYYRCTKKKGPCLEKHFLRQEKLYEQIKSFLQKVSLSSHDTEKVLAELEKEESHARERAKTTVQNLKTELLETQRKLEKLLDVYLEETITAKEYASRKEILVKQKVGLQEQIRDFEQKGLSWLEPAREFVLSLNQAAKLLESGNKSEMTTFLKNIGSNCILQNRQLIFSPKIQYELAAEPAKAGEAGLTCSRMWTVGESDSRLSRARRLHCHYANSPDNIILTKSPLDKLGAILQRSFYLIKRAYFFGIILNILVPHFSQVPVIALLCPPPFPLKEVS